MQGITEDFRKVRDLSAEEVLKSPFEIAFLKGYDQMYFWADKSAENTENMDLDSVFKETEPENHMVHGDYNYHNLLVCQEGMAGDLDLNMRTGMFRWKICIISCANVWKSIIMMNGLDIG